MNENRRQRSRVRDDLSPVYKKIVINHYSRPGKSPLFLPKLPKKQPPSSIHECQLIFKKNKLEFLSPLKGAKSPVKKPNKKIVLIGKKVRQDEIEELYLRDSNAKGRTFMPILRAEEDKNDEIRLFQRIQQKIIANRLPDNIEIQTDSKDTVKKENFPNSSKTLGRVRLSLCIVDERSVAQKRLRRIPSYLFASSSNFNNYYSIKQERIDTTDLPDTKSINSQNLSALQFIKRRASSSSQTSVSTFTRIKISVKDLERNELRRHSVKRQARGTKNSILEESSELIDSFESLDPVIEDQEEVDHDTLEIVRQKIRRAKKKHDIVNFMSRLRLTERMNKREGIQRRKLISLNPARRRKIRLNLIENTNSTMTRRSSVTRPFVEKEKNKKKKSKNKRHRKQSEISSISAVDQTSIKKLDPLSLEPAYFEKENGRLYYRSYWSLIISQLVPLEVIVDHCFAPPLGYYDLFAWNVILDKGGGVLRGHTRNLNIFEKNLSKKLGRFGTQDLDISKRYILALSKGLDEIQNTECIIEFIFKLEEDLKENRKILFPQTPLSKDLEFEI